ncbi:hypothetical protein A6J71_00130 [Enterobacter cancerogenus]|nr:hypothetical protein A6J71_00130 [Enterobacter cancerogenus]
MGVAVILSGLAWSNPAKSDTINWPIIQQCINTGINIDCQYKVEKIQTSLNIREWIDGGTLQSNTAVFFEGTSTYKHVIMAAGGYGFAGAIWISDNRKITWEGISLMLEPYVGSTGWVNSCSNCGQHAAANYVRAERFCSSVAWTTTGRQATATSWDAVLALVAAEPAPPEAKRCTPIPPASGWCSMATPSVNFDFGTTNSQSLPSSIKKTVQVYCSGSVRYTIKLNNGGDSIPLSNGLTATLQVDGKPLNMVQDGNSGTNNLQLEATLTKNSQTVKGGAFNGNGILTVDYP